MKQLLSAINAGALVIGILTVFNIAFAQDINDPYQQFNQSPPPLNEINTPSPEQPPVNEPLIQEQLPEPVVPAPEQPTLYQVTPKITEPTPQIQPEKTILDAPLPAPITNSTTARPANLLSPSYYLPSAVIIILVFFWFGWWRKLLKNQKKTELPAEQEMIVCKTCGGKGTVTKKRTITAPCNHCQQTGRDICHYCGGTGRNGLGYGVPLEDIENYPKCDYCGGKGFPKLALPCCMCKGKRKEEAQESYEEKCPTCKGTGQVAK